MTEAILSVAGAVKRFGGVQALRGVDFDVKAGEIHALLGENGAGKSTLMNLLSGVYVPDEGTIRLAGKPVRFASPRDAQAAGIATIFQELDLVPGLDVAANLFLGHELMHVGTLVDNASMLREAQKRLEAIDLGIDPARRVSELSVGQRQVVAIVKALSYATKVLIMDEPTAALTVGEVDRLFGIMRKLAASGVGIIYISHRLEEVPRIADRVTVMRDARVAGVTRPDAPQAELVRLLVGRPLEDLYPQRAKETGKTLLHLKGASFRPSGNAAGWQTPENITLDVREGEIVGLAGIMGAGRTELLSALYGTGVPGHWVGDITVDGKPAKLKSVANARKAGISFVTDDRRGSGLMLRMSVGLNLVMSVIRRISPNWIISVPQGRRSRSGNRWNNSMYGHAIRPSRWALCQEATSRKWFLPRKCSAIRACCCLMSRRVALTLVPRAKSMRACVSWPRKALAFCSHQVRCRNSSACVTASWFCKVGEVWPNSKVVWTSIWCSKPQTAERLDD